VSHGRMPDHIRLVIPLRPPPSGAVSRHMRAIVASLVQRTFRRRTAFVRHQGMDLAGQRWRGTDSTGEFACSGGRGWTRMDASERLRRSSKLLLNRLRRTVRRDRSARSSAYVSGRVSFAVRGTATAASVAARSADSGAVPQPTLRRSAGGPRVSGQSRCCHDSERR
jgi:hypothetical protein